MKKVWIIFIAMLILVVFTAAVAFAQGAPPEACEKITLSQATKTAIVRAGCAT